MEQLANASLTFVPILVGAIIFALVSVFCGFSPFYDLEYAQALTLCGIVGWAAFLLSDIPDQILSIAQSHAQSQPDWAMVRQLFHYAIDPATYPRLAANGLAFAFIISGFIGSDLILNFRKFLSRKEAGRTPTSVWDALLWLYGKSKNDVTIWLKDPTRTITGKLDFRSIGSQTQEVLVEEPHGDLMRLGAYLYVKGSDIQSIALHRLDPFTFQDMLKALRSHTCWPYLCLLGAGMVTFIMVVGHSLSVTSTLIVQCLILVAFLILLSLLP